MKRKQRVFTPYQQSLLCSGGNKSRWQFWISILVLQGLSVGFLFGASRLQGWLVFATLLVLVTHGLAAVIINCCVPIFWLQAWTLRYATEEPTPENQRSAYQIRTSAVRAASLYCPGRWRLYRRALRIGTDLTFLISLVATNHPVLGMLYLVLTSVLHFGVYWANEATLDLVAMLPDPLEATADLDVLTDRLCSPEEA